MAKRTKRPVPLDLLDEWKRRFMRGDVARIAEQIGVSREIISIAMKQGQAEPYVIIGISRYYAERETPEQIIEQAKQILQ